MNKLKSILIWIAIVIAVGANIWIFDLNKANAILSGMVVGLIYLLACEYIKRLFYEKKIELQTFEIDQLRWSYKSMGKYIKKFNIPELDDIDYRIENELRDIEVKKQNFKEMYDIKE